MSSPPTSQAARDGDGGNVLSVARSWKSQCKSIALTVFHHVRKHTGVGIVCAVAYFDPGNWGVDLEAGSEFGYSLLFVVLLAGIFGVFFQVLASRLGCVTGMDLASHCRLLLYDRPKHKLVYRWLVLYPLYAMSEIAIISTDLAELLGSAIALVMFFPRLPLWAGVLITSCDVLIILAFRDPLRERPVKVFEFLIAALVLAVLVSMIVIMSKLDINWGKALGGYVPSKNTFAGDSIYTSVGILGATVMPHSLFLGSTLATQDRLSPPPPKSTLPRPVPGRSHFFTSLNRFRSWCASAFRVAAVNPDVTEPRSHADRENNSLAFVRAHLFHGVADMVISLLSFAVLINSLILILASAVFYKGSGSVAPASLFDAHDVIRDHVGKAAAFLFALSLLASGQSASIIATVAGQAVSEGFLRWRVSPVVRRLFTRIIGLIPSMIVAAAVGPSGVNTLLVASQVVLSIVLPFVTLPLLYLTSSKRIMSVRKIPTMGPSGAFERERKETAESAQVLDGEKVDFSNGKIVMGIGFAIWLVVLAANMYVIVNLARG